MKWIIIWDRDSGFVAYVSSVYTLLARVLIAQTSYFAHIMSPVDAHEIFRWYHMYFSAGSHFAQNLKMTLLSLSLNLGAPYYTQS